MEKNLFRAIQKGDEAAITRLASQDVDLNQTGQSGATPLHLAAVYGHTETAKLLLDAGDDPTARDQQGRTPEDIARKQGHPALADRLHEAAHARRLAEPVVTGIDWAALVG